jgi:ATP-dependent Clp protease ATP-binding subunit ClpC
MSSGHTTPAAGAKPMADAPIPTPRYERVVNAAASIAVDLGHSHLGVEHLFVAIARDQRALPTQLAKMAGVDLQLLAHKIIETMKSDQYNSRPPRAADEP